MKICLWVHKLLMGITDTIDTLYS